VTVCAAYAASAAAGQDRFVLVPPASLPVIIVKIIISSNGIQNGRETKLETDIALQSQLRLYLHRRREVIELAATMTAVSWRHVERHDSNLTQHRRGTAANDRKTCDIEVFSLKWSGDT
jgi:hypothetical protein